MKNRKDQEELRGWGMDLSDIESEAKSFDQTITDKAEEAPVQPVKRKINKFNRKLTNEDIQKYDPMVEKYIRDNVAKNWNEADTRKGMGDNSLGNTGQSLNDIRQHLRAEVCIALYNFDPNYLTKEGRTVKESTFVFQHLYNRTGQLMKRLTKKRYGYGLWHANIEETLWETDRD